MDDQVVFSEPTEQHPALAAVEKLVGENDLLKYYLTNIIHTLDRWACDHISTERDIKNTLELLLAANSRHKFFDEPYIRSLKKIGGANVWY